MSVGGLHGRRVLFRHDDSALPVRSMPEWACKVFYCQPPDPILTIPPSHPSPRPCVSQQMKIFLQLATLLFAQCIMLHAAKPNILLIFADDQAGTARCWEWNGEAPD